MSFLESATFQTGGGKIPWWHIIFGPTSGAGAGRLWQPQLTRPHPQERSSVVMISIHPVSRQQQGHQGVSLNVTTDESGLVCCVYTLAKPTGEK